MKELNELVLPDELLYAKDHEWARLDGDLVTMGISDYAQDQLGDIVFVELPEVGKVLARGDLFGTVESVKTVSDLLMPFGGEVTGVNEEIEDSPELINDSPYEGGWLIAVKVNDPAEVQALMDKAAYEELLKGLE